MKWPHEDHCMSGAIMVNWSGTQFGDGCRPRFSTIDQDQPVLIPKISNAMQKGNSSTNRVFNALTLGLTLLAATGTWAAETSSSSSPPEAFTNPVYTGNLADPFCW